MSHIRATGALTDFHSAAQVPLGSKMETPAGKVYRYVQFVDAVTYAAGHVVSWTETAWTVSNDRSGGSVSTNRVAGVCLGVATQNYYGWIQTKGEYATVLTNGDDDIAAEDGLILATGTDGACDSAADPATLLYLGWATAADVDANNTVAAFIDCE